ncbi:MAG: hypothetical protein KJZ72_18630 [Anaerolineales bacterium]|nr:hypothetical protein [Anaerolineales bacterium]
MKLEIFNEPELEFGKNTHLCPRAGISQFGVYDTRLATRRTNIHVGAVGISDDLDKLAQWLDRCKRPILGKAETNQPELFPAFCGFNSEVGYKAEIIFQQEITRSINLSEVRTILKTKNWNEKVNLAVELFYRHIKFLAQNRPVDVVICVIPDSLYKEISKEETQSDEPTLDGSEDEDKKDVQEINFRRALKAKIMHLGKPTQLIISKSLDTNAPGRQDDATKAWNFSTALYYKANQTVPWKLVSNLNRPSVCFVGIGFYRSRDKKMLHTSLAQIFDELGNGVILRGTPVLLKDDRVPHLSHEQSYDLLCLALDEYNTAMDTSPARLVIHKSSNFNEDEIEGFREATQQMRVNAVDYVTIMDSNLKLFRDGIYPPYRGTHVELDESTHLLYTRGSVAYYRTYPGKYIPQSLEVRIVESDESPGQVCREILGLTKMNWNNTQFDQKYPITLGCARKVGQIMKYVPEDEQPQIRYSFYM